MARNKYPEETIERIIDVSTTLFLEKGCEKTTIQDIINALGDLSKGAIYHHFKSKEDIIIAVVEKMYASFDYIYEDIKMSKDLTAIEKLKKLFHFSVGNREQKIVIKTFPNLLKNPKILALQLDSTINQLSKKLIEPIILEGIEDGTIKTDFPKELAEVLSILTNIYLNPLIFPSTSEELYRKCLFFKFLMSNIDVDIFDDEIIEMIEHIRDIHEKNR